MEILRNTYQYARSQMGMTVKNDEIPDELFRQYMVNRGLRDINGKGVLTGLTNISEINSFREIDGKRVPIDGELWYRGYSIETLVKRFADDRYAYEILTYLLLFGELPDKEQKQEFIRVLTTARNLQTNFVRDVIMKAPTKDIMNSMTRSILTLASYDKYAQQTDLANVIRQSINLIATFPMLAIYGYHAYNHYENLESMYIHRPDPEMSTAENILMMLRPDRKFTRTEAKVLQAALLLHMEHGGGNNSTFTTRVVTSSDSDTYATIAAAMSSLKGPKHGGANIKVMEMMDNIRENVRDWTDDEAIEDGNAKVGDPDGELGEPILRRDEKTVKQCFRSELPVDVLRVAWLRKGRQLHDSIARVIFWHGVGETPNAQIARRRFLSVV